VNPDLWLTRPLLALASILPVPLGMLWMALAPQLPALRGRRVRLSWLTWLGTRVAFAIVVWGLLGHQGTDQLGFFLPQARHVLAGQLPYRDFPSAYGPLFAPLLAVAVAALGDTGPFVLFLLADFVAWRALAAAEGEGSDAAWMWAALPAVWYLTVRYAQDEALAAAFLALALLASRRERPAWAGMALGLGLLVTKLLFLLPALPLVLGANRRGRIVAWAALPVAIVYGGFLALGAPVLQPFALESAKLGVGPTLWGVPAVLAHLDLGAAGGLAFAVLFVWGLAVLLPRRADAGDHAAWQYGAFAAVSPKFMPMYLVMWAPLLCVWAARDADRRAWLALYCTLLPLAWYLESGPLQGLFGPLWRGIALVGLPGIALLALWPLWALRAPPRPIGS
jgi:hypothetical protein